MLTTSKHSRGRPGRVVFVILLLVFFASLLSLPARIGSWFDHVFISAFKHVTSNQGTPATPAGSASTGDVPPELAAELESLRLENAEMRRQLVLLQNETLKLKHQLRRVADLKNVGLSSLQRILAARVIARRDSSNWVRSIGLDRGDKDGVRPGMPVTVGPFLVGVVSDVGAHTCRAKLVTDANFTVRAFAVPRAVGLADDMGTATTAGFAIDHPTERHVGIFKGDLSGACSLRFIPASAPVARGWVVMTADDPERGWPEGLCIGKVSAVKRDSKTCNIVVTPFADVNKLDSVLLLDIAATEEH